MTADVEAVPLEQIIKQLNKLLHVLKIVELDPNSTVERELVLIKVAANESNRSDVLEIVRLFRVRVVDVNPESLTIEATGAEGKIDALLGLLEHYGVIELVRSGAVAVTRGPRALSEKVVGSGGYRALIRRLREDPVQAQRRMRMMHIRLFFMRAYLITRTASKTTAPHASIMTATRRCIMATLTIRKYPMSRFSSSKKWLRKTTAPWNLRCDPFLKNGWLARWRMKSRERPISMTRSANS